MTQANELYAVWYIAYAIPTHELYEITKFYFFLDLHIINSNLEFAKKTKVEKNVHYVIQYKEVNVMKPLIGSLRLKLDSYLL